MFVGLVVRLKLFGNGKGSVEGGEETSKANNEGKERKEGIRKPKQLILLSFPGPGMKSHVIGRMALALTWRPRVPAWHSATSAS